MEKNATYFYPSITCTECLIVTKDWKWIENPIDEVIYGVCLSCEEKVKTQGLKELD